MVLIGHGTFGKNNSKKLKKKKTRQSSKTDVSDFKMSLPKCFK